MLNPPDCHLTVCIGKCLLRQSENYCTGKQAYFLGFCCFLLIPAFVSQTSANSCEQTILLCSAVIEFQIIYHEIRSFIRSVAQILRVVVCATSHKAAILCLFLKENGKLQLLIFFLTLVDFSIASIRLIFPRRVNTRLFIVSILLFDSSLRNLPPYFSISKLNELDLVSYYLFLFREHIRKLWRILNSTMFRIRLYMCSFLVSFILCSSSTNTSKYLS